MRIIKGDLIKLALSGEAKYIVHGCNCFHAMGSGIAGALAQRFPEIPEEDKKYSTRGDHKKLTNYTKAIVTKELRKVSFAEKRSDSHMYDEIQLKHPFTCINLYTQYQPGSDFLPSLFSEALKRLNKDFKGQHLWFPMIGCGIGGGDWTTVQNQMLTHLTDVEVTVVIL